MNNKNDVNFGEILKELSTVLLLAIIVISAFWSALVDLTKKY